MGKIRGVSPVGGSGVNKSGRNKKAKKVNGSDRPPLKMRLKPFSPKLSEKVKAGSRRDNKTPSKRDMKEQGWRLMSKIKKRRQPVPSQKILKCSANKKEIHRKVPSSQLRERHQGFVPHKARWAKSVSEPYEVSKVIYGDDQYLAGISPEQPFDPEHITGDAFIFWEVVFEEETEVVIDLTSAEEGDQFYYPKRDEHYYLNDACLAFLSEKKYSGYKKILLQYKRSDAESKRIIVFHYYAWPEKSVLRGRSSRALREFVKRTRAITDKPLAVICRSGKGKSGAYIVMQQLLKHVEQELITVGTLSDTLEHLICIGREASDTSFVETDSQFIMLVEAAYAMLELFALKQRSRKGRDDMNFLDDYI